MYLVLTDNYMFKIAKLASAVCGNPICEQRIGKTTDDYVLLLNVEGTAGNQNISYILRRASNLRSSFKAEY